MTKNPRPISFEPDPSARKALGPAPVLGKSVVGRSVRDTSPRAWPIDDSLSKMSKTSKTPSAAHPMGETAKIRTGSQALSCWHCQQSFFQYGAQKLAGASSCAVVARLPIAKGGAEIAEIASAS